MSTEARYIGKCRTCKRAVSALGPKNQNVLGSNMHGVRGGVLRAAFDVLGSAVFVDDTGESGVYGGAAVRCSCGRVCRAERVMGKVSARHVCGAKCLASTSGKCECSCGGKNHGASFAA